MYVTAHRLLGRIEILGHGENEDYGVGQGETSPEEPAEIPDFSRRLSCFGTYGLTLHDVNDV